MVAREDLGSLRRVKLETPWAPKQVSRVVAWREAAARLHEVSNVSATGSGRAI